LAKKLNSKKKIIIAASLLAVLLVGAIVSIVLVLAANQQGVSSNITVSYNVEGVAAKASANYAIVSNAGSANKTSMKTTSGSEEIVFNVGNSQTTETISPQGNIELDVSNQTVVFEYVFENLAETSFVLELTQRPVGVNMTEKFLVTGKQLNPSKYASSITNTTLAPQAVTYEGQKVYVYIMASVTNENLAASYNGGFAWNLENKDKASYNVILNNGTGATGGMTTLPVISTSTVAGIMMPSISAIPQQTGKLFAGYYSAANGSGTKYYDGNGTPLVTAVAAATTMYAHYIDAYSVTSTAEGTEITNLGEEPIYVEPSTGSVITYGNQTYTTNGEYVMVEGGQSVTLTGTASYADGVSVQTTKPSDLAEKKFYAAYGAYPQTYVGATLNSTLISATLTATGKTYTTDINGTTTDLIEYEYNGVRYAKLEQSKFTDSSVTFSTGDAVASNATYFFYVEPIVVKAMEVSDNSAIVMSVNILGSKKFDGNANDWETSELRTYLNGTFLEQSGLGEIAQSITIQNNVTGNYTDGSGTATTDKIWLASKAEIESWLNTTALRKKKPTDMAMASYCFYYKTNDAGHCFLRSASLNANGVCYVDYDGSFRTSYRYYDAHYGFLPAFSINL